MEGVEESMKMISEYEERLTKARLDRALERITESKTADETISSLEEEVEDHEEDESHDDEEWTQNLKNDLI